MTRSKERVLVTGAAGFIGSHLVERLLARGDRVVGVDNFDPFYSENEKRHNISAALTLPAFQLMEVDCADIESLQAALGDQRFDAIVHLAAKAGVRTSIGNPIEQIRCNVQGTQVVLEVARQRNIQRFVFGSSSSVYGNSPNVPFVEDDAVDRPISPYAATKRAGELLCHAYHHLYGMAIVVLRLFTVYGPRQRPDLAIRRFATSMLRGQPITMFGEGTTERDYTWIGDIVDGVVAALDRTRRSPAPFEIVNLGEGRTTSLTQLIDLIAQAVGVEPRIIQEAPHPGDVARTCADVTKAHHLLDYCPTTPVEDGIARFVEWLRRHEQASSSVG